MKSLKSLACVASVMAMSACAANAAVLFSDTFGYADGNLDAVAPAPLWGIHSGTVSQTVVSGAVLINQASSGDHNARFTPTSTGTLYAGLDALVQGTALPTYAAGATNAYFFHFSDVGANAAPALGNGFRGRVWAAPGSTAGTFQFALATSSGVATAFTSDLNPDTVYRLVVSYDFTTQVSQLWVNPVDGSTPATLTGAVGASGALGAVALRGGNTAQGNVVVDNVVVADTLGEAIVIPEPASLSVLALGGLMLGRRRRA